MNIRPTPGLSDSEHHIYRADSPAYLGNPADSIESERVAWLPLARVPSLIEKGEITSGTTLAALLYVLSVR